MSRTMRLILLALKPSESRLLRTKKVWKSQQKKGGAKDCVCVAITATHSRVVLGTVISTTYLLISQFSSMTWVLNTCSKLVNGSTRRVRILPIRHGGSLSPMPRIFEAINWIPESRMPRIHPSAGLLRAHTHGLFLCPLQRDHHERL